MSSSKVGQLPPASAFVGELVARVDRAYPATLTAIIKVLAKVEPRQALLLGWMRHGLTRSAFVLGCAAEEIGSVEGLFELAEEKRFVREVVSALSEPARPLPAKRTGPALRRLIREFKLDPTRSRTRTVQYMLELHGLEDLGGRLEAQASCCLTLECTVSLDGIAGVLWDQITADQAPLKRGFTQRRAAARQLQF